MKASDAVIADETVSVKVLTVGKRSMTKAVYDQLDRRHIVDLETVSLLGKVWGRTNQHDKHCPSYAPTRHVHIVWQDGEQLKVCTALNDVYAVPGFLDMYDKLATIAGLHLSGVYLDNPLAFPHKIDNDTVWLNLGLGEIKVHVPRDLRFCYAETYGNTRGAPPQGHLDRLRGHIERECEREGIDKSDLGPLVDYMSTTMRALRQRWDTLYSQLESAPLLLIAA